MNLLVYNELHPKRNEAQFKRVCKMLEDGDYRQAEVKKLAPTRYFRAKLNDSDRLLFSFMEYRGERFILLLEIIYNHEYEKSRFLNGAAIDENRIEAVSKPEDVPAADVGPLFYRNPSRTTFHLLDRPLSFDDLQEALFSAKLPLILVGSAGSGKTVLSLEKVKTLSGEVLYVTRSSYLADNARRLYCSNGYDNPGQSVDFLSFEDLTRSIRSPEGRQAEFTDFCRWYRDQPHRAEYDVWQLYEEFYGVITGHEVSSPYLGQAEYLGLGIKQSIFPQEKRETVYTLFLSWLTYMGKNDLYLETIRCHELLKEVPARYDWLVVDEVQDLTNVQLFLALKCLKNPYSFLLCGDSNQIVHPNFFSWSAVKSLFFKEASSQSAEIQILHSNYRNSKAVTEIANRILRLKVHRFGSVDRESNFLVDCTSSRTGEVKLLPDVTNIRKELNDKTANSVHYAVIVLRESDKSAARQMFRTPLVFSVRESKGLEYRNVIVCNIVSRNRDSFQVVAEGVNPGELNGELKYSRNKDKSDRSLEIYKFFINSLYVAVTRAVENIYWLEQDCGHPMFRLLELSTVSGRLDIASSASSADEWRKEAAKLAAQGKKEQSARILTDVLKLAPVPWEVTTRENFHDLLVKAIASEKFNTGSKQKLADYAYSSGCERFYYRLAYAGFKAVEDDQKTKNHYVSTYQVPVNPYNRKNLRKKIDRHGIDFRDELNRTPLMLACEIGDAALIEELLNLSADPSLMDNRGFTAFHLLLRYIFRSGWNKDFAGVIRRISPQSTTLRLNGHEIKIGSHKAESLMYHISWMIIHSAISYYRGKVSAIESSTICEILSKLPDFFVPAYRKAQNYCSAILSKNEANSTNPYGLRLFYRLRNGHYILNPALEIPYNGKWLFWDELAMMDYWNLPLEYLPYDAVRQLIEDVRMHCKNPDIRRSFLSVYFLKVGFCRYLPLIQDYPPVCGADLAAALKRIQSRMAELPPLPLKREDLNSQNGGKTFYSRPWIYPGETPEEVTLRNYFRHHPESSPLLQKEYQLLLEQQRAEIKKDPSQMQMPQDENEKRAREVAAENERLNRMEEIYRKHMREIEIMDRERERFRKEAGEDLYKEVYRKDFNLNVQKEFLKKTTPDLFSIDDDEE